MITASVTNKKRSVASKQAASSFRKERRENDFSLLWNCFAITTAHFHDPQANDRPSKDLFHLYNLIFVCHTLAKQPFQQSWDNLWAFLWKGLARSTLHRISRLTKCWQAEIFYQCVNSTKQFVSHWNAHSLDKEVEDGLPITACRQACHHGYHRTKGVCLLGKWLWRDVGQHAAFLLHRVRPQALLPLSHLHSISIQHQIKIWMEGCAGKLCQLHAVSMGTYCRIRNHHKPDRGSARWKSRGGLKEEVGRQRAPSLLALFDEVFVEHFEADSFVRPAE